MSLAIENPNRLELSPQIERILRKMFADYGRVILRKEFQRGLSGARVLEVRPIKGDGTPELPAVVKIATISFIQTEWRAYRQHIRHRLPNIAQITNPPVFLLRLGWGGLRYSLMGGGTFEVTSLHDYCRRAEVTADDIQRVVTRLLRVMHHIWGFHHVRDDFRFQPSYDQLLPVQLLISHPTTSPGRPVLPITPDHLPTAPLQPGDPVRVAGFALSKVNPATQTMTLKRPQADNTTPAYYVRCKSGRLAEAMASYRANQIIEGIEGEVIETRAGRLLAELRRIFGQDFISNAETIIVPSPADIELPNPLSALSTILNRTRAVNLASIHGDFNFDNILIEPETGQMSLVDFAEVREDHVLHDLLRLETEVLTKLMPPILKHHDLPPGPTLAWLYWQLHQADFQAEPAQAHPPQPELAKPWAILSAIRGAARQYFYDAADSGEYYQALLLYLLGALKFKNLNDLPEHPLPKQIAFWGATIAYQFLTDLPGDRDAPPPKLAALLEAQPQITLTPSEMDTAPKNTAIEQAGAERRLAALPLDSIPSLAHLPPHSRMPLGRNPLFVGRAGDLKRLAQTLKGGETVVRGQFETAALTGLGGLGKTQLVSEFVHRYGQFFAGGVFWLSFADPTAIPVEVAACGGAGGLELRPNFRELPFDEQVHLVMAAWQSPLPRLLIFDNCEDPDMLARWRPSSGGSRVLVTSRRADWDPVLGVRSLPLDSLGREESLALLREYQPDADDETLSAIAAELGHLPLALSLAGSYLARYRRVITPAQYLAQLRDPNLLEHRSLKGLGLSPTGHVQNVYRTISLSYDQLDPGDEVDT